MSAPIPSGVEKAAMACLSVRNTRVTSATLRPSRSARASSCFCTSGVSTQPGQMALHVMPSLASSSAVTLVRPDDAVLGSDVGGFLGAADQAVGGRDVDDANPAVTLHAGDDGLGGMEGARQG